MKEETINDLTDKYEISDFEEYEQILSLAESVNERIAYIREEIESLRRRTIFLLITLAVSFYLLDTFASSLFVNEHRMFKIIMPITIGITAIAVLFDYFSKYKVLESKYNRERHVAKRLFNIISSYKNEIELKMKALQKAVNEMRLSRLEFDFKDDSPFLFSIIENTLNIFSRLIIR